MALAIFATRLSSEASGDPKLERLFAYWNSRRIGDRLPRRRDLLPEDMAELLGRIKLVNVQGQPPQFSYRLFGTILTNFYGSDLTGRSVDDVEPEGLRQLLRRHYEEAVRSREPVCHEITVARDGKSCRFRCLLMPVSLHDNDVDILLGAANWEMDAIRLADLRRRGGHSP